MSTAVLNLFLPGGQATKAATSPPADSDGSGAPEQRQRLASAIAEREGLWEGLCPLDQEEAAAQLEQIGTLRRAASQPAVLSGAPSPEPRHVGQVDGGQARSPALGILPPQLER